MKSFAWSHRSILAVLALFACAGSGAQTYPSKPIHWVVPYAAGGGNDTVTRAMASVMQNHIGQPVLVENRASATGIVGIESVARAAPDGYTIVTAGNELVLMKLLYKKLSFDPQTELAPLTLMANVPIALFVHESIPAKTIPEFVSYAKANPGKVNFGSPGVGHGFHLAMEMFLNQTGTQMFHVPYKGTALVMQDLFAGRIQAVMYPPTGQLAEMVKKGTLRALAAGSSTRLPMLPDAPTFAEAGMPNYSADGFFMACAPAGIPKEISDRLAREVAAAVSAPQGTKALESLSMIPRTGTPEQARQFLAKELASWTRVVNGLGIVLD